MLDQFKEQELSNVVWAFAKLHHYKSDMFQKLLQAVTDKLPHFLPQVRAAVLLVLGCFLESVRVSCARVSDSSS